MTDATLTIFTEREAADVLRLKTHVLKKERLIGRIGYYKIVGGQVRYTTEQIREYLAGHPMNAKRVARVQVENESSHL